MTKQKISFAKMHGLGNDFVVIHDSQNILKISKDLILSLADRHSGIGFDQLLIIRASQNADFYCDIYNADGSIAEQCGNGLRCVARYISESGLKRSSRLTIETLAGIFKISIHNFDSISAEMGIPKITTLTSKISVGENSVEACILSLGNPHAIITVPSVNDAEVATIGKQISTAPMFENGINVGFMQIVADQHIKLRTYERGIGETSACGSNACAAAATGILRGWLKSGVKVQVRNGSLEIFWQSQDQPIQLCGPASHVFNGELWV